MNAQPLPADCGSNQSGGMGTTNYDVNTAGLTAAQNAVPAWVSGGWGAAPLDANGGNPPYLWLLHEGNVMPPGLALTAGGVINGRAEVLPESTPRRIYPPFTVVVWDMANPHHCTETQITVTVINRERDRGLFTPITSFFDNFVSLVSQLFVSNPSSGTVTPPVPTTTGTVTQNVPVITETITKSTPVATETVTQTPTSKPSDGCTPSSSDPNAIAKKYDQRLGCPVKYIKSKNDPGYCCLWTSRYSYYYNCQCNECPQGQSVHIDEWGDRVCG